MALYDKITLGEENMIYLIASNSYHLIDDEINKIVGNKEYQNIDFNKTTLEEIITEANYTDLFSSEKILVIKNATFFQGKGIDTKILEDYLEHPNGLTTLIFTCETVDERKKISKIIKEKYHYNVMKPLYAKEITSRIVDLAKKSGYTLKIDDATFITNASLNNYDMAYNTLEKIFLYYNNPCNIETTIVHNLTSMSLEDNNFKFVDAVVRNDLNTINKMIKDFKIQKIEPLALFNLIAREYRLMLLTMELYTKNTSRMKMMSLLHIPDWQLDKLIKNAFSFTKKDLEDKLLTICDYDYKIKSGKIDKYLALEMFVLGN